VVVLDVNKEKQEISLGMKQTETNPWDRWPRSTHRHHHTGRVRNLTNYGAFVEIEEGIDGLLHVSDMSWTKKISHPSEMLKKGEEIECVVLKVDQEKKRIALGLKQLQPDPWTQDIPTRFHIGDSVPGTVTKITNFGVFVELEQGLEGLLHVSELADHKVDNPEDVVKGRRTARGRTAGRSAARHARRSAQGHRPARQRARVGGQAGRRSQRRRIQVIVV
jgi:small subunit ribosomal protein S1